MHNVLFLLYMLCQFSTRCCLLIEWSITIAGIDLFRYESAQQAGREEAKELVKDKFVPTIRFVEQYLCSVRLLWATNDNEQSKLTCEVWTLTYVILVLPLQLLYFQFHC